MDQTSGTNILMLKIEKGDLNEIISCIKKYPKYVNMKNKSGNCALTTAIRLNDLQTLKVLLDNKANVNTQNKSSQTPVYVATFNNQIEVVSLLIQYNANIKTPDSRGWNPLMVAANKGYIEILKILLDSRKCDLFQRNTRGETVFELAKNKDVLDTLIDNCGYEICEIECNLGNSIMCGIRAKLSCQNNNNNNSLFQVQNSNFDAGNFYAKEVKRVQNTFKSICENNRQQLNKLKNGLANLSNSVYKKHPDSKENLFLSENKYILNQNKSSQKQNMNSINSQKPSRIDKNSPDIASFRYDSQSDQKLNQNNRQYSNETQSINENEIYLNNNNSQLSNATPSKKFSNNNSNSFNAQISSQRQQNIESNQKSSQNIINPISEQKSIGVVSHAKMNNNSYVSIQQYTTNASTNNNSTSKNSNKKVSSFIVSEELPEHSFISSHRNSSDKQKGELTDIEEKSSLQQSSRFKEIEEDFLTKSNSELISQFKNQLIIQIKQLNPNMANSIIMQYEKNINYFIEHLICNNNLTNLQKILVLMQFQSQILIEIVQQQNSNNSDHKNQQNNNNNINNSSKNHIQQTRNKSKDKQSTNQDLQEQKQNLSQQINQQTNNRSSSNLSSIQKKQLDIIDSDTNISNQSIQQQSQQKQKFNQQQNQQKQDELQLKQNQQFISQNNKSDLQNHQQELSNQNNSNNINNNQSNVMKEKYYQMAKNKHFQMDGIIEQPTLEMIETPSQGQSQNKKIIFSENKNDSNKQSLTIKEQSSIQQKNQTIDNQQNLNESYHSFAISSPKQLPEEYESTLRDTLKDNSFQIYNNQNSNTSKILDIQSNNTSQQNLSQKQSSPISRFLQNNQIYDNTKLFQDYTMSGQYLSLGDKCLDFHDKLDILSDVGMNINNNEKYNTIESSQGAKNFFNINQKNFNKLSEVEGVKFNLEDDEEFNDDNKDQTQNDYFKQLKSESESQLSSQQQSSRDNNLFQKVHVFNGNKCQAVQSSIQTSKPQSQIDYEISLSSSALNNHISQQFDKNHNIDGNYKSNDNNILSDNQYTQQINFNQYQFITDGLTEGDFQNQSQQKFIPTHPNDDNNGFSQTFLLDTNKFSEGFKRSSDNTNYNKISYSLQDFQSQNLITSPQTSINLNTNKMVNNLKIAEINDSPDFSHRETENNNNQSPQFYQNINLTSPDSISQFTSPTALLNQGDIHQSAIQRLEKMQKTLDKKITQIQMNKNQNIQLKNNDVINL